jgi:hypothetical protein
MAEQVGSSQHLIIRDSFLGLQNIETQHLNNTHVLEIIMQVHGLLLGGQDGLAGNVAVDAATKAALTLFLTVSFISSLILNQL